MPVLMCKDVREALGKGAQKCESRSLLQNKFVFFDDGVKEYKRVSLDFILTDGAKDLNKLWDKHLRSKQSAEQRGKTASWGYKDACSFLDATKDVVAGRKRLSNRAPDLRWLSSVPETRKRMIELRTADRLMVGMADGVLENCGLTLHRFFGVPCIRGSAIKGIARDAAASHPDADRLFIKTFGNPQEENTPLQGAVGFLDAFSADEGARIELDVCTPHFPKYYGHASERGVEVNPKALDTENPIPNVFPAVAKGVRFRFVLLLLDKRFPDAESSELLDFAGNALRLALIENGIGAKTAAGYGRFTEALEDEARQSYEPESLAVAGSSASSVDPIIAKWKGKVTKGNFKLIAYDLASITAKEKLEMVFMAIMPEAELKLAQFKRTKPFWQSFMSIPQAREIMEKLNMKLG